MRPCSSLGVRPLSEGFLTPAWYLSRAIGSDAPFHRDPFPFEFRSYNGYNRFKLEALRRERQRS